MAFATIIRSPKSVNRPVIMAAGTPQILLPWDNAAVFQRNLDAQAALQVARHQRQQRQQGR